MTSNLWLIWTRFNPFSQYAELEDTMVLYKFQLAGVADHVWAVLQVPGPEYKVMQSYNMGNYTTKLMTLSILL